MNNEKTIIGSCLLDGSAIDEAASILTADDFKNQRHRAAFQAIIDLQSRQEPVDVVTVNEESGVEIRYLSELMDFTPVVTGVKHYAGKIKQASVLRRAFELTLRIQQMIDDKKPGILEYFEEEVMTLGDSSKRHERKYSEIMKDVYDDAEKASQNRGQLEGLSTGFTILDNVTGGLQPGKLYIIAARPAMGKTAFIVNMMDAVSVRGDVPSILYSLEMEDKEIAQRGLCSHSSVVANQLKRGMLESADYSRLMTGFTKLAKAPIYIDDTGGISISDIRSRARRAVKRHKCGLIAVDYLQLIRGKGENKNIEVGEISRSLKEMAKELKVPVVALAQLNRGVELRAEKRPVMADLRDSGSVEQDADAVFFLYRDFVYNKTSPQDQGELIVAKNRAGKSDLTIPLKWEGEYTRYLNVDVPTGRLKDVHD